MKQSSGVLLGALLLALAAFAPHGVEATHVPGAVYSGRLSNGGYITIWLDGSGAVRAALVSGCPSWGFTTHAPVVDHQFAAATDTPDSAGFVHIEVDGVWAADGHVGGRVQWVSRAGTDCPTANITWSATRSSSTGLILSGALPAGDGFGLIVFGGGTSAHLVLTTADACPLQTAVYWVTEAAGEFVQFVPAARVEAVNAAWTAKFAAGIPSGTPMVVKCR